MYEYQTRIRYSEINSLGILSLPGLIDYFQDCSIFHSEDLGMGIQYLDEHHMFWALSSWQIVVNQYPKMGEYVTIGTAPYEFKGFTGCRNFWMRDENNNMLACANSIWSLIDKEKQRPVKPTEEMIKTYELSEKIQMDYADRRIKLRGEEKIFPEMIVKSHNIDTNLHVNNGQYIQIGLDYLEKKEIESIKQLRAEYKMQAVLHTKLYPKRFDYDNCIGISLQDEKGKSYCNMEFTIA